MEDFACTSKGDEIFAENMLMYSIEENFSTDFSSSFEFPALESAVGQQGLFLAQLEDERARVSELEKEIIALKANHLLDLDAERTRATVKVQSMKTDPSHLKKIGKLTDRMRKYRRQRNIARKQLRQPLAVVEAITSRGSRERAQEPVIGSRASQSTSEDSVTPFVVDIEEGGGKSKEVLQKTKHPREFFPHHSLRFGGRGKFFALRMFAESKTYCAFSCDLCCLMKKVVDVRMNGSVLMKTAIQSEGLYDTAERDLKAANEKLGRSEHLWNQCIMSMD